MQGNSTTNACPRCARENSLDHDFCVACALPIDGLCPVCGTQNDHSAHFCRLCNHDFSGTPVHEAPARTHTDDDLRYRGSATTDAPSRIAAAGIDCPRCMHTNPSGSLSCENCGLVFASATEFRRASRAPATIAGFAVGGLWHRVGGFIVDALVIFAVFVLLAPFATGESIDQIFERVQTGVQSPSAAILDSVLSIGYETLLIGAFATTIGKKLFSLSVIRIDGSQVSFRRSLVRASAKTATLGLFPVWIVMMLVVANVLMVAVRQDKRAIHDLIAGTAVVRR